MTGYAILLLAAAIAFGLAKLLRLPAIPLLMLSGVGLRALADSLAIEVPPRLLQEMIEIGLAVLVFTAGVDLSPRRMRGRAKPVALVAVTQFVSLGIAGVLTALLLDYSLMTALYLGCALSASSTLVVVRHLQQRQQMFEPFGRLVLGVLLLQDVFIILLMVALLSVPAGAHACALSLIKALGLGSVALVTHKWLVPWVSQHLKLDEEELLLGALSLLFAFSGIAYLLGLPFLVGAFLAGFALSAFPMNGLVRGMLGSLSGFFLALFFISVGAVLTMPSAQLLGHSLIFVFVLIVVTVVLVAIVAEWVGYSTRAAVEAGILLSQTSEFSILLAFAGMSTGQITAELFSTITLITVGTMTLTPFMSRSTVAWNLMRLHPRYRRGEHSGEHFDNHAVLLGYGRAGRQTVQVLQEHGIELIVIDDDASVIHQLIQRGIPCIQGDGSDQRVLSRARTQLARVVLCSMRRSQDALLALDFLRDTPVHVVVRTFEPDEAERVRAAGGYPVETAPAAAKSFIGWLEANQLVRDAAK